MNFWTQHRRERFKVALKEIMDELDIRADDIEDYVRRHKSVHGFKKTIQKRTVERFLSATDKTEARVASLDAMLLSVSDDIRQWPSLTEHDESKAEALFQLREEYEQQKGKRTPEAPKPRISSVSELGAVRTNIAHVADVLLAYLHLGPDASKKCEAAFFNESDGKKKHFITYRYSSETNIVQKSFTVIHRPSELVPIVRFANFFEFENRTRKSSGIALMFGREVFFFGQSDKGQSAKSLVFNNATSAQDRYTGLVMTHEPHGGAVSARFVMQRTDLDHHKDANTGLFEAGDPAIELDLDSKDRLRNRVQFCLEDELIDAKGREVPQMHMVVKVDEMISEGTLPNGQRLALQFAEGGPFNPADHQQYTFNSALKIRD